MTDSTENILEEESEVLGVNEAITLVLNGILDTDDDNRLFTTDSGNGRRYADLYRHIARYVTDLERWCFWNGHRWELDVEGNLKAFALTLGVVRHIRQEATDASDEPGPNNSPSPRQRLLKHAKASESVGARTAMLKTATAIPELQASSADFDARGDVLACDDKLIILDTDTTTLAKDKDRSKVIVARTIRRSDMVTFNTRAVYRPQILNNPPALIKDYLTTFIPDEIKQHLIFKALGSCIVGGNPHRLFIIVQGESTTGKTQLVEGIFESLGPEYTTIGSASVFRGNMDDKARPDILKAIGKRIAFFSEASRAWELHADRVKDLTGGGTISARRMRENEFQDARPNFTPVLVTNALPKIIGADSALLRRMIVFEFNNRPLVEDTSIRDRFISDSSVHEWLLARLVKGYADSIIEGLGDVMVAQGLATMTAFDNLTHLGAFFRWLTDTEQLIHVSEEEQKSYGVKSTYVTLKDMFDRYSYWVKEYGGKRDASEKLDYESFNEQLGNNGWEKVKSGSHRWAGKRLISLLHLHGQTQL